MKPGHHVDQMGNTIHLINVPTRIVSLVPSQTELLYALNLSDQVVGITKFCIHPNHWKEQKTSIGGTKNFNFDLIDALAPDLIIGNKEENYADGINRLKDRYPVWMSDITSFSDALEMIRSVGELTNRKEQAIRLVHDIERGFRDFSKIDKPKSSLYFIWRKPWMVAGANTFIDTMLQKTGFKNCASGMPRYPILNESEIAALNPELIFLSTEPYPFSEKHLDELKTLLPDAKILLVDGEYFSWYGSRLKEAPAYFSKLIDQIR